MKKLTSALLVAFMTLGASATMAFAEEAPDTERPGNVKNFVGTALDGAVRLSWDATTDNVAVTGYDVHYGTSPVTKSGESYDEVVDVGNVLQYTVNGLDNGEAYYFSVVAYDAAGNESAKWAKELELMPSADGGSSDDGEAPQVTDAEAINKVEVKVEFSEAVVLPEEDPEDAFTLEVDDTLEPFAVLDAVMDEDDETGKTVILTTEEQTEGVDYKLTVGIDVEDKAGNPVISGTSDTAIFTGSALEKEAEDTMGPEVMSAEATVDTHVLINFNETVVLGIDPTENFSVMEEADSDSTLQILGVSLVKNTEGVDDAAAIVTTSKQEDVDYVIVAKKLKDQDGNTVEVTKSSAIFAGAGSGDATPPDGEPDGEDPDTVAPSDVARLLTDVMMEGEKYMVELSWEIPAENIGDVVEQLLYMSTNKGADYTKQATLAADDTEYTVANLEAGEYWFKLTQVDGEGNESDGVIKKVMLSETGPGLVGLLAFSLVGGRVVGRRRRK